MKKYQVIGGQYVYDWKGESDTIRGAQIIARKNEEYWDNWKGWHVPAIYLKEDVEEITLKNDQIVYRAGTKLRVPKEGANPYIVFNKYKNKWEEVII